MFFKDIYKNMGTKDQGWGDTVDMNEDISLSVKCVYDVFSTCEYD